MTTDLKTRLARALEGYTIEHELGGGGMSRVFLAEETALGRRVVVKVLPPELAHEVSVERFRREISLAARLRHPLIVPLLVAGEADGLVYYTMPFLDGESLSERLQRERQLPLLDAVRIARELALALDYAHAQGIVHRDLKPSNVLLDSGHAVIADFGIARAIFEARDNDLTSTGLSLGTPAYMSPEQASGDAPVDRRSDIYSLGCVLYEMLAGEAPFTGGSAQSIITKRLSAPAPSVRILRETAPVALEQVIAIALARSPADRFTSAADMAVALDTVASHISSPGTRISGPLAMPPLPPSLTSTGERRRRVKPLTVAAVAAPLLLLGTAWRVPPDARAMLRTIITRPAAVTYTRRVVVAPFDNQTGDSTLTPLGTMASDWITQALARTGRVDVVDARSAQITSKIVGSTPRVLRSANDAFALGEETGAGIVVSGTIYRIGDSLSVATRVISVPSGRLIREPDPVVGTVTGSGAMLDQLRARTLAALAAVLDSSLSSMTMHFGTPPSYDAYQEFNRGVQAYFNGDTTKAFGSLKRAVVLDTSYVAPRVAYGVFALEETGGGYTADAFRRADSISRSLDTRRDRMTPSERALSDWLRSILVGDKDGALQATRELPQISPGSVEFSVSHAATAISASRPREALEELDRTSPTRGINLVTDIYWSLRCAAEHRLGRVDAELLDARRSLDRFPDRAIGTLFEVQALAALGRESELAAPLGRRARAASEGEARAGVRQRWLLAVRELRAHGYAAQSNRVLATALAAPAAHDTSAPGRLYYGELLYLAGRWNEADAVFSRLAAADPTVTDYVGFHAVAAARRGDRAEVDRAITRLGTMKEAWRLGAPLYWRARIAAVAGRADEAVDHLAEAERHGYTLDYSVARHNRDPHSDEDLAALRGNTQFVQLLAPRG